MGEKDIRRPTAVDAARRLIVLKHVAAYAVAAPPRRKLADLTVRWTADESDSFRMRAERLRHHFWAALRDAGLWTYMSPAEQAYAQTTIVTMTSQAQIDATWRIEAIQMLMWSQRMLSEIPPYDTMACRDIIKEIPSGDALSFIEAAELRDDGQIDRQRDVAELWVWRSRTRQLIEQGAPFQVDDKAAAAGFRSYEDVVRFSAHNAALRGAIPLCIGDDFPARGKAYRDLDDQEWSEVRSIALQRYHVLNWLCGRAPGNKWEATPLDT